ncbi:L-threonine 3-dehydrogenase [Niallia endozanthoxylica]|uniref:L-threonine 3-dehydrogenase n=1 Tax=Niallia endozanthoxylica TaxID=2036016 RepID=A0A5J5HUU3_9BACI|nr:L-threonine 3-dehydrogenase [Niallia endozanthoxylica]KAA9025687.1 L-threonine 3-dehydrogenase [Niallia endozanthoxylica]
MKRIMITGALGQIGSELTLFMRKLYGEDHVLASDIRKNDSDVVRSGPFELLDVTDRKRFSEAARTFQADTIIHLAALLSAVAERNPLLAWHLNMGGLLNALETARETQSKFFTPSSIGVFGPSAPKIMTPQVTSLRPVTMYGVNKVAGELLSEYYFHKYGVDTRGLRFPGLISHATLPGGGTTDYAVEIFYDAILKGHYTSYLRKETYIDMMYMPDALQAIIDLMEADPSTLKHRNAYNVTSMSFSPEELASEIKKHIPIFTIDYKMDPIRQGIADSWPDCIDASAAMNDWGFTVQYDLTKMTKDMIEKLSNKLTP